MSNSKNTSPRLSAKGLLILAAVFFASALVLKGIFSGAEIYGDQVAMLRYCDNPEQAMELVRKILTEENPAENAERRPYIVAAKLLYLVPQRDNEPVDEYIQRLRDHVFVKCAQ